MNTFISHFLSSFTYDPLTQIYESGKIKINGDSQFIIYAHVLPDSSIHIIYEMYIDRCSANKLFYDIENHYVYTTNRPKKHYVDEAKKYFISTTPALLYYIEDLERLLGEDNDL
jgi:hypothetical protein